MVIHINIIMATNMKRDDLHEVLETLSRTREVAREHLPIDHSFIPFDILLHVFSAHTRNERLSVKGLFAKLPFSDMGIRYHFDKLVSSGWITLAPDETDGRVKLCAPSNRLIDSIQALALDFKSKESQGTKSKQASQNYKPTDRQAEWS